ncbi:MAG: hypothetical protein GY834_08280 [Bacteroidetes bacterium]|nr:hypothetical protein [Bacteroidota bacterium]
MDEQIFTLLNKINDKQDSISKSIAEIEISIAKLPCGVHHERLSLLQVIVYGAVGFILLAFLVSLPGSSSSKKKIEKPVPKNKSFFNSYY